MPAQDLRGFSERVALVTGADSGVGRAVALQLALQGAYVVAQCQPGAGAEAIRAAEELREIGTLARVVSADVTTVAGAREVLEAINGMYGRLDYLVNTLSPTIETDPDLWEEQLWDMTFAHFVRAAAICSKIMALLMQGRPSPAIVSVGSKGTVTDDSRAMNAAAASALSGMTEVLAAELGPKLRVNCVLAGNDNNAEPVAANEVARAVVYFLSSDAGAVSGQTLFVGSE